MIPLVLSISCVAFALHSQQRADAEYLLHTTTAHEAAEDEVLRPYPPHQVGAVEDEAVRVYQPHQDF